MSFYVLPYDRLLQVLNSLNIKDKGDYSTDVLEEVANRGVVQYIIQGAYLKSADDFRIDLRIQKAGSWQIIGSERLSGQIERQMSMVDELTRKAKSYFNLSARDIAADIDLDIGRITTGSPEALAHYNEGLKYWANGSTARSIESLKKAVDMDPQFALAHALLAWQTRMNRAESQEHAEKACGERIQGEAYSVL